ARTAGTVRRGSVGREGVRVARLAGLVDGSVAAGELAVGVAAVPVGRVAVVAVLGSGRAVDDAVAAEVEAIDAAQGPGTARAVGRGSVCRERVRIARLAGLIEDAVAAAGQRAIVPATVRVDVVAVAAEGAAGVPAGARTAHSVRGGSAGREGVRVARLAGLVDGAVAARELAVGVAAVPVDRVAVVAVLGSGRTVHDAVAAEVAALDAARPAGAAGTVGRGSTGLEDIRVAGLARLVELGVPANRRNVDRDGLGALHALVAGREV